MDYMARLAKELGISEVVTQAAMTTGDLDANSMKREMADRFINQVVDESTLLKNVRVHRTDAAAGDISKLSLSGPVTYKATEATETTDTRKPTNAVVSFATKKTTSAIDISGELTEDNIEGPNGKNTMLNCIVTQIGNDMEQLAIEGDDSISGSSDAELLLKTNDGWKILTASGTGAHIVDAGGLRCSYKLFSTMLRALPKKYRRNLGALRWIISSNTALDLIDEHALRLTDLGDTAIKGGILPPILGIPGLVVPLMPEDLTIDGTAGDTGTHIWLTDPKNFIYVVQRDVKVEWEHKPRKDLDEATVHMRTDFIVEEVDAVVCAVNVNIDQEVGLYGAT